MSTHEIVQQRDIEPIRVRLERGQRGNIGWEISVSGDNPERILEQVREIDRKMSAEYGKPQEVRYVE